jgi:PTS system mannose-specific IIC component
MTLDSIFVHMMDNQIKRGEFEKIPWTVCVLPELMAGVFCVIPVTLAAYFGASYIQPFINACQGTPMTIFGIIGGLMPALGIAITLQYIFKGEARIFLFLGFIISTCFGLTLVQQGVIGLITALIYIQVTSNQAAAPAVAGAAAAATTSAAYDPDED